MTSLRPPRRPLTHPGAEHVVVWLPDGWMVRVLHAHPDPARAPTRPRTFGPIGRFDPHVRDARQKPREQPDGRGVIYLGDTFAVGMAESFPDQWPDVLICPNQRAVQAAPPVPVELVDLTGDGAMAIGAVGTLGSRNEPRWLTQRWGRAIYEDLADLGSDSPGQPVVGHAGRAQMSAVEGNYLTSIRHTGLQPLRQLLAAPLGAARG